MKKGFCGNARKGTRVSTGVDAVDLQDQHNNTTRVCYQTWGAKEEFQSGSLGETINDNLVGSSSEIRALLRSRSNLKLQKS